MRQEYKERLERGEKEKTGDEKGLKATGGTRRAERNDRLTTLER